MDFFAFDKAYVERLRNGDPATEHHFFLYFAKLLQIKLRARAIGSDKVEDLKQDTFVRVIAAVRKEGGVRQPERFGAFVNSICNNVLLEYYRWLGKNHPLDETREEIPDKLLDLDGMMVSKQCSERCRRSCRCCRRGTANCFGQFFFKKRTKIRCAGSSEWTAITCGYFCTGQRKSSRLWRPSSSTPAHNSRMLCRYPCE